MGKGPSDLPTVTAIELDRRSIRLNHAKTQRLEASSDYFRLPMREQTLAYPMSTAFAKQP
jgi:hypothetical protein